MGNFILGFIYYGLVGSVSVLYKVFGINPFKGKNNPDTYWEERDPDRPVHVFTLRGSTQDKKQGGES
ncbi:MAG: hypothetical protein K8T10_11565 [Candidatus Eremiobacteraeota bacterium]|nr:hypothetical protein [Candidatus Eremiobacteraeota bacterium]